MDFLPAPSSLVRTTALTLILALGLSVGAAGQTLSVRGNVGASFFRSPETTSTVLNSGSNLGVEAELRVYRGLGITLGATYDSFSFNEENARIYSRSGGDLSFLGGGLGLRYTFLNNTDAHPYVTVGGGFYRGRVTDRKQISSEGQLVDAGEKIGFTEETAYLGVGSLFRLDDTYAVFAEPRYTFFDLGSGLGGALRYFTLRLGVDVQL